MFSLEILRTKDEQDGPSVDFHIGIITKPIVIDPFQYFLPMNVIFLLLKALTFNHVFDCLIFITNRKQKFCLLDVFDQVLCIAVNRRLVTEFLYAIPVDDHTSNALKLH